MTEQEKESLVYIAPWAREWMRQFGYADLEQGMFKRDRGAAGARSKVLRVDPDWTAAAEELVLSTLMLTGTLCSDEVTYMLPVPVDCHPSAWGSIFKGLSQAGKITCVGYKMTAKPSGHAGLRCVWELA